MRCRPGRVGGSSPAENAVSGAPDYSLQQAYPPLDQWGSSDVSPSWTKSVPQPHQPALFPPTAMPTEWVAIGFHRPHCPLQPDRGAGGLVAWLSRWCPTFSWVLSPGESADAPGQDHGAHAWRLCRDCQSFRRSVQCCQARRISWKSGRHSAYSPAVMMPEPVRRRSSHRILKAAV